MFVGHRLVFSNAIIYEVFTSDSFLDSSDELVPPFVNCSGGYCCGSWSACAIRRERSSQGVGSMSISRGSGSVSSRRRVIFALVRWSVTLASKVRILRNSSATGPVFVTRLGWTLTVGSAIVSSARDNSEL